MKMLTTPSQWDELPQPSQEFILIWKKRKHYPEIPSLTLGECIELLIAISYTFHKDYSDGRFYNNILLLNEASIAWDGEELIDTIWYDLVQILRKRAFTTFNATS